MRSAILFLGLLSFLPISFLAPQVGVMVWAWLNFMSPHQETFGFTSQFPLVMIVALVTIVGWLASKEPKKIPLTASSVLFILFAFWFTITSVFSFVPETSWEQWNRHIKSFIFIVLIFAMFRNKARIHGLIWVICISLGYYAIEGGLVAILSGGSAAIYGPRDTMIHDNNHFALALVMTTPLMNYLRLHTEDKWIRLGLIGLIGLTLLTVIATYSRGGLIGLIAMLGFLWLKSRKKVVLALATIAALIPGLIMMPAEWTERMETIQTAEEDGSFQGRLEAWGVCFEIAVERPLIGGGFNATHEASVYQRYRPDLEKGRSPHSIYFQVMGHHGFVGLALFLALILTGWLNASYVARKLRRVPGMEWARDLAVMIQVSLVGYVIAGAALSMAYYDMFWALLAIVAQLRVLADKALKARAQEPEQAPATVPRQHLAHRRF